MHGILLSCLRCCPSLELLETCCFSYWFNQFHFLFPKGILLAILIDCIIFLSPLVQRDLCQQFLSSHRYTEEFSAQPIKCYVLTYHLNVFKSRVNRYLFNCRFILNRFSVCFNLLVLLLCDSIFFCTSCLAVAVQPCIKFIQ